ncbi:hypothetical protein ACFL4A_02400 [bacterium]
MFRNIFRGIGRGLGLGRRGGQGRGMMQGNKPGSGPVGYCICPSCKTRVPHQRGCPCYTVECPNCGNKMIKE